MLEKTVHFRVFEPGNGCVFHPRNAECLKTTVRSALQHAVGRTNRYLTSISSYSLVPRPIFTPCSIIERQLVSGCVMLK